MTTSDFYIVGVGASAGGQDAIRQFFSRIPPTIAAGFVLVTHLHREFKSELPAIVARNTKLRVQRITNLMRVEPGTIYVMPENTTVTMKDGLLHLEPRGIDDVVNKAIDIFFKSLAEDQKNRAIGVVLSGMGSDGSSGAVKLFEQGGDVLVQEPTSTPFNGMPYATIMKDHPDYILPPHQLGEQLARMIESKIYVRSKKLG